jgi:general secretion pathway protein K
VILVNVLAMVAVAAALVMTMLAGEVPAVERATAFGDADRALAIARGGELTVIAALRRDLAAGGDRDNASGAWAHAAQATTAIDGGTFRLAVADAQGRFNVNAATGAGEPQLAAITTALGLNPDIAERIAASIAARGRVGDVGELARAGIDDATLARLRALVTALPGAAPVNVNAASPALLAALTGDGAAARVLADRRARAGRLTLVDFAAAGVSMPPGAGFTSDHFIATTTVVQGATTVTLTSLIERRREPAAAVVAIQRWLGPR